jgi:hypothetical protein
MDCPAIRVSGFLSEPNLPVVIGKGPRRMCLCHLLSASQWVACRQEVEDIQKFKLEKVTLRSTVQKSVRLMRNNARYIGEHI